MATPTATVTLTTLGGGAATVSSQGGTLEIKTAATDAQGFPSGQKVQLSSSNTNVAKVTTARQLGNAPAGVVGVSPGTATITATADDNANATATLAVTVT